MESFFCPRCHRLVATAVHLPPEGEEEKGYVLIKTGQTSLRLSEGSSNISLGCTTIGCKGRVMALAKQRAAAMAVGV